MIVGVGVDLVEVARVRSLVERWGERFLERVFTPEEVADAGRGADFAASLAVRFAAKEATYKALRGPLARPLAFRAVRVAAGRGAAPALALAPGVAPGGESLRLWCSLTHTRDHGCAVVVAETTDDR